MEDGPEEKHRFLKISRKNFVFFSIWVTYIVPCTFQIECNVRLNFFVGILKDVAFIYYPKLTQSKLDNCLFVAVAELHILLHPVSWV
jgi:hypothetical protein